MIISFLGQILEERFWGLHGVAGQGGTGVVVVRVEVAALKGKNFLSSIGKLLSHHCNPNNSGDNSYCFHVSMSDYLSLRYTCYYSEKSLERPV